jgi:hypothetical protein
MNILHPVCFQLAPQPQNDEQCHSGSNPDTRGRVRRTVEMLFNIFSYLVDPEKVVFQAFAD